MLEISINGNEKTAPESWNEASLKQALSTYSLICREDHLINLKPEEVVEGQSLSLAALILGFDKAFLDQWKQTAIEQHGDQHGEAVFLAELSTVVNASVGFAFQATEKGVELRYELTKNPYPKVEIAKRTFWYGPADALSNITLLELGHAFTAFESYVKSGNNADAHRLLAILFRPGKPSTDHNVRSDYEGDRRLPLLKHETTIEGRIPIVARWPLAVRRLLVFWFASCRAQIIKRFPHVFKTEEPMLAGERVGNNYGYAELILALAGQVWNLDATAATNANSALVFLSRLEDQRIEAELAKRKRTK